MGMSFSENTRSCGLKKKRKTQILLRCPKPQTIGKREAQIAGGASSLQPGPPWGKHPRRCATDPLSLVHSSTLGQLAVGNRQWTNKPCLVVGLLPLKPMGCFSLNLQTAWVFCWTTPLNPISTTKGGHSKQKDSGFSIDLGV